MEENASGTINMETYLYLVRHAQSNPSVTLEESKWPLSALGRTQAQALVEMLAPLGISKMSSSPYLRCVETIRPFADKFGIEMTSRDGLREHLLTKGIIEGFFDVWKRSWDDFSFALPGCETAFSAQARIMAEIQGIVNKEPGKVLGISSHGNVIGLFLNHLDASFHRAQTQQMKNPDVFKVVHRGGCFEWDRAFVLPGLEKISTNHADSPIDR